MNHRIQHKVIGYNINFTHFSNINEMREELLKLAAIPKRIRGIDVQARIQRWTMGA
jgi:hypothetical protein